MDWLMHAFGLMLHLDQHLEAFSRDYGAWLYALLFIIIFCETGLVFAPFLPGDSLLFVAGALAASLEVLNIHLLVFLLIVAAIAGDTVNFGIGRWVGPRAFRSKDSRLLNRKHLESAQAFYDRHGGKTIVIARFVPVIRTYAPFVAGMGSMGYEKFVFFNVTGAMLWVALLSYAGYWFGNIPWIKLNIAKVIIGIILVSLLPIALETWRNRRR